MFRSSGNSRAMQMQGLYPGSGVAPGGQQGRIGSMHNGITGARKGGYTPGASAPKVGGMAGAGLMSGPRPAGMPMLSQRPAMPADARMGVPLLRPARQLAPMSGAVSQNELLAMLMAGMRR